MTTGKPRGRPRKVYREAPPIDDVLTDMCHSPPVTEISDPEYPSDWHPGMLLNVHNTGSDYTITLYPEEYDPRHPERALRFTNPGEAQNFVSQWYSRQSHDPRAG